MKIKVNVSHLIECIEGHRADAEAKYEAEMAEYAPAMKAYAADVADILLVAAKRAKTGDLDFVTTSRYSYEDISVHTGKLIRPSRPLKPDVKQYDKDLALLHMASEGVILISTDDHFASYL